MYKEPIHIRNNNSISNITISPTRINVFVGNSNSDNAYLLTSIRDLFFTLHMESDSELYFTNDPTDIEWLGQKEGKIFLADNPFACIFPPIVKHLAEKLSFDLNKPYFISTHNPYILGTLLTKTSITDLNLFIVFRDERNYINVKAVSKDKFALMIDLGPDVFFNLDKL